MALENCKGDPFRAFSYLKFTFQNHAQITVLKILEH